MLSKASAAMPENRIAEYVYQLALPTLDRGAPGCIGPIGIARNQFRYACYQCSFCLQETPIEKMNYIIALQRLFSGDFYVFYVSIFLANQNIREYTKSIMHQKYVCFDCTQKCSAYVREKEYCTWNIRVADVLQLFDGKKAENVLPVLDLWHIVMQYTNPRYITLENRKKI